MTNPKLIPLAAIPIPELQALVGSAINVCKGHKDTRGLHVWVSVAEYLKDAQRWQHVRDNCGGIPEFETPTATQDHVDFIIGLK